MERAVNAVHQARKGETHAYITPRVYRTTGDLEAKNEHFLEWLHSLGYEAHVAQKRAGLVTVRIDW